MRCEGAKLFVRVHPQHSCHRQSSTRSWWCTRAVASGRPTTRASRIIETTCRRCCASSTGGSSSPPTASITWSRTSWPTRPSTKACRATVRARCACLRIDIHTRLRRAWSASLAAFDRATCPTLCSSTTTELHPSNSLLEVPRNSACGTEAVGNRQCRRCLWGGLGAAVDERLTLTIRRHSAIPFCCTSLHPPRYHVHQIT